MCVCEREREIYRQRENKCVCVRERESRKNNSRKAIIGLISDTVQLEFGIEAVEDILPFH